MSLPLLRRELRANYKMILLFLAGDHAVQHGDYRNV